jgi:hypothetical protein
MPGSKKETAHYITLKEAAKISGYTPDYLGQLIRKGKLEGKQIYLNVAWVTTEQALRNFLQKNKTTGTRTDLGLTLKGKLRRWWTVRSSAEALTRAARKVLYLIFFLLVLLCIFLIIALFSNLGRSIHP